MSSHLINKCCALVLPIEWPILLFWPSHRVGLYSCSGPTHRVGLHSCSDPTLGASAHRSIETVVTSASQIFVVCEKICLQTTLRVIHFWQKWMVHFLVREVHIFPIITGPGGFFFLPKVDWPVHFDKLSNLSNPTIILFWVFFPELWFAGSPSCQPLCHHDKDWAW